MERAISLLPGEYWWGGRVVDGHRMPFHGVRPIEVSLAAIDSPEGNQIQPLLLSNRGRYVWSDAPFQFAFRGDELVLNGDGDWELGGTEDGTLRDAFRAAQKCFPPSGEAPARALFDAPQYNTWIELLYEQTQERILRYARDLIAHGYPPGVLMIDDNWQEDYGVWTFSARRFPDPKAMMMELRQMGFTVMLWTCPFVSGDSPEFRWLAARGLLIREDPRTAQRIWTGTPHDAVMVRWWNGVSAVLDLSNPEAVRWYWKQLDTLIEAYGVAGFKFDAGDSAFYVPESGRSEFRTHQPRTPEQHTEDFARIGLHYPLNEYRACWKMAGQPLGQRLRDKDHSWEALRELIPGVIAQGLMGYAFVCPDLIGGGLAGAFEDPAKLDPELVVRSAQVQALMPMMQFSVAPWRVLDPENEAICRAAATLHLRTRERIQALVTEAAKTGEPMVRSLAWEYPGGKCETISDQFLLGSEMLVAPVMEKGARRRTVALPPGRWRADDGLEVSGPSTIDVKADLSRLPYFERISL